MEDGSTSGPLRSCSGTADPEGHSTYEDELGRLNRLRSRAVSNGCAEPGGGGLHLPSGAARRAIHPRAVPPRRIASMIANASRPPCDEAAQKLGVSFATVWRRADRAGIELTAGGQQTDASGFQLSNTQ